MHYYETELRWLQKMKQLFKYLILVISIVPVYTQPMQDGLCKGSIVILHEWAFQGASEGGNSRCLISDLTRA